MQTVDVVLMGTTAPTPINRPTVVLTDRGHAVRLLYRLVAALGVLDGDGRQAVRALFLAELDAGATIA
jgi:hypothetical protein